MKEKVAGGVVGHECVEKTVAIVICKGHAHSFARLGSDAGLLGDIGKCSVPVISIQSVVRWLVVLGMAIAAGPASDGAVGILVDLPFAVVDHEEIEQAIVVVVEPARAGGPHLLAV